MHPVITGAPVSRPDPGSYAVTAEFHDILQADRDAARVRDLYGRHVARARLGVLDIGAGTGRVTLMSLAESAVDVHAVEPARAMRTSLLTRLATLPAGQRERVTVHPYALDEAALYAAADVAVCHNTVDCLPPAARDALWPAIQEAPAPGGTGLLEPPPALLPRRDVVRRLPEQRVGAHVYGGRMTMSAAGYRIRTRVDYWVPQRTVCAAGAHGVVLDVARLAHSDRRRPGTARLRPAAGARRSACSGRDAAGPPVNRSTGPGGPVPRCHNACSRPV
ncbi:methyltransferase [Streptomyces griseoloalbus]|uniref:Methyltransferase n=1 Tax=Streptomyces griseoloalbus TaxID=67303 RepID=A0ABV3EG84_9ACTN